MKSHPQVGRSLVATIILLIGVPVTYGAVVVESFESGDLNGWGAGTLNGTTTTVTTDHASDGTFSAANLFTVPANFSGWSMNTILQKDPRSFMDAGTTTLSLDVYSDWSNPNGWGVYANNLVLILNNSNSWSTVAPISGSLVNGGFSTLTWDMTPYVAAITDSSLGYSIVGIGWHVGTWAGGGDGLDNGTQTFAIDTISVTSVPEPSSVLGVLGAALLAGLRRRR